MIAYPLFVKDPYFSIWSGTDRLNEENTIFWTGDTKRTFGILKIEEKSYCFLGNAPGILKMEQREVSVSLFRTTYSFSAEEAELRVAFFSPLPMNDLTLLSMPVCFLEYEIIPKRKIEKASIYLCVGEDWCHSKEDNKEMRGDVFRTDGGEIAYFGLNRQHILNRSGDRIAAEWGYYYLGAMECFYHTIEDFSYVERQIHGNSEDSSCKYLTGKDTYFKIRLPVKGRIIVAVDDVASINYFGRILKGYYLSQKGTVIDAIRYARDNYDEIEEICRDFEKKVKKDSCGYSENYKELLNFSYRQTVAAHKLVADYDGTLLFLSKECGSGGCVATVDVTYPTMPLLALYNPELLRASMEPVFKMAALPMWDYPFAPHDVGMYPYCCGQYYAVKVRKKGKYYRDIGFRGNWRNDVLPNYYLYPKASELYNLDGQMPVEECANMILIANLYLLTGKSPDYIKEKIPYLRRWCEYLIEKGLVPEKQLCTDDFMDHLDKNVNLAIKSVVAIRAFAEIVEQLGENGDRYREISEKRAVTIQARYKGRHMPLSFDDKDESYSMKYNLLWDKLLGFGLFEGAAVARETVLCIAEKKAYGFPLDSRTKLTKTDWMMWMAALSDDSDVAEGVIQSISAYLRTEGAKGKPFPDLYDCETGETRPFVNRTVQGSMFVLLLKNKLMNGGLLK